MIKEMKKEKKQIWFPYHFRERTHTDEKSITFLLYTKLTDENTR